MKVVLLAGGFGTRISEESHLKPKPMIEIGGNPILWHIMKIYSYYGFDEFIICCGYKQHIIKEYFADYYLHMSDITFDFKNNTEKNKVFATADFALNPMLSGSGTNLKMFDYMAAGLPIITTEFGTRGIDNKNLFIISDIDNMSKTIEEYNLNNYEQMILKSRKYVEENFDWKVISERLKCEL